MCCTHILIIGTQRVFYRAPSPPAPPFEPFETLLNGYILALRAAYHNHEGCPNPIHPLPSSPPGRVPGQTKFVGCNSC